MALLIYINRVESPLPLQRVMLFGDSYGRDISLQLPFVAREVMFLRMPYLRIDLVDSAKPDVVFTQNAERYLPHTQSDEGRPCFFLYPFLKDQRYSIPVDAAQAFSAFFSADQKCVATIR